ncbi:hypothetical protein [Candidatus Poriferisodalis sp.]|uniref:hypothetical protein n=1 Tax=Candidatus Poriferisodalis sp. TaxID=3101277 RepID=UPI003C6F23D4
MTTIGHAGAIVAHDEIDLNNAQLMRDACIRAAGMKGTKVIWVDPCDLPPDVDGMFTNDPVPAARQILIRTGLHPVEESIVLAHEIGHLYDPALNTYAMQHYYERNYDVCEAVAHYSSWVTTDAYLLNRCLPTGYFESYISPHFPLDELRADNDLIHRSDAGSMACMYPKAREDLANLRTREGRELSGVTGLSRVFRKMNSTARNRSV